MSLLLILALLSLPKVLASDTKESFAASDDALICPGGPEGEFCELTLEKARETDAIKKADDEKAEGSAYKAKPIKVDIVGADDTDIPKTKAPPIKIDKRISELGLMKPSVKIKINVGGNKKNTQSTSTSAGSAGGGGGTAQQDTLAGSAQGSESPSTSHKLPGAQVSQLQLDVLKYFGHACYTSREQSEYEFEVCLFKQVTQRETNTVSFNARAYSLGKWAGFVDCSKFDDAASTTDGDISLHDYYRVCMQFDGGDSCPDDILRSTMVSIGCGVDRSVYQINEPAMCQYRMRVDIPELCPEVTRLLDSIAHRPIRLEGSPWWELGRSVIYWASLVATVYLLIGPLVWDFGGERVWCGLVSMLKKQGWLPPSLNLTHMIAEVDAAGQETGVWVSCSVDRCWGDGTFDVICSDGRVATQVQASHLVAKTDFVAARGGNPPLGVRSISVTNSVVEVKLPFATAFVHESRLNQAPCAGAEFKTNGESHTNDLHRGATILINDTKWIVSPYGLAEYKRQRTLDGFLTGSLPWATLFIHPSRCRLAAQTAEGRLEGLDGEGKEHAKQQMLRVRMRVVGDDAGISFDEKEAGLVVRDIHQHPGQPMLAVGDIVTGIGGEALRFRNNVERKALLEEFMVDGVVVDVLKKNDRGSTQPARTTASRDTGNGDRRWFTWENIRHAGKAVLKSVWQEEPMSWMDYVLTILSALAISYTIRQVWPVVYYDYLYPPPPIPVPTELQIEQFFSYVDTSNNGWLEAGELSAYFSGVDEKLRLAEIEQYWGTVSRAHKQVMENLDGELLSKDAVEELVDVLDLDEYREDWAPRFEFADQWGNKDGNLDAEEALVMVIPDLIPSSRARWWKEYEFPLIDSNGDSIASWEEYVEHLKTYHSLSDSLLEATINGQRKLWLQSDEDLDNLLTPEEYSTFSHMQWSFHRTEQLFTTDEDNDGRISSAELLASKETIKLCIFQHRKLYPLPESSEGGEAESG